VSAVNLTKYSPDTLLPFTGPLKAQAAREARAAAEATAAAAAAEGSSRVMSGIVARNVSFETKRFVSKRV
jgi:hypothetical protein